MANRRKSRQHAQGAKAGKGGGGDRELYLQRLRGIFGLSPDQAEGLVSQAPASSLRLNRLSPMPHTQILAELERLDARVSPVPWCSDAYFLESEKRVVSESRLFTDGHLYIQNASSLIPPLALDPRPGERILDVCAAPGGKAAHIAARVGNDCELWVNDAIKPRVDKLRTILDTYRVRAAEVLNHEAQYIDKYVDTAFDRILLDAQCSGDGMLDLRHPNALRYWNMARVRKYSYLQQRMLRAAFRLLKPGGVMVYSTCAFSPEENEAPVSALLTHVPEADVETVELDVPEAVPGLTTWEKTRFDPRLARAIRIRPSTYLEGFFVCRIRRRE